jgi:large subunit ribosomal protein L25
MSETIHTQVRDARGKHTSRQLRRAGSIPAVLYGHGQPNISLAIPIEELEALVRHGARVVKLTGAVDEQAFVREMQWDTWGKQVLHVDFTRISEHEKVKVRVPVELRGEAAGIKEGGVVEHLIHELEIECEVMSIPEHLTIKINQLRLNQEIRIRDLELPPSVTVLDDAELVVVLCKVPEEVSEESAAEAGVEPELIGRKPSEEEEE